MSARQHPLRRRTKLMASAATVRSAAGVVASTIEEDQTCVTARFVSGRPKPSGSVCIFWITETRTLY
jgi:hypothetical protein